MENRDDPFRGSSYFLAGAGFCVVLMLVMFELERPVLPVWDSVPSASAVVLPEAPVEVPVPPHLTRKIVEYMARDGFELTRQKCDGDLCVSCFITRDARGLYGETWTLCSRGEECVELDTTAQKEYFGAQFGACERDEVPPITKAN